MNLLKRGWKKSWKNINHSGGGRKGARVFGPGKEKKGALATLAATVKKTGGKGLEHTENGEKKKKRRKPRGFGIKGESAKDRSLRKNQG